MKVNGYLRSILFVVAVLSLAAVWMGWRAGEREKGYVVRRRDIAAKLDSAASVARGWPGLVAQVDTLDVRVRALETKVDRHMRSQGAKERP